MVARRKANSINRKKIEERLITEVAVQRTIPAVKPTKISRK
jgi:hypothetical protein